MNYNNGGSRYWKLDSYQSRFESNHEPEKYDKDCVRDYVKRYVIHNDVIPEIPVDLIQLQKTSIMIITNCFAKKV